MQHLEGSGTPVLYIGRKVPKGLYKVRQFILRPRVLIVYTGRNCKTDSNSRRSVPSLT
jgi:hypothetical protein